MPLDVVLDSSGGGIRWQALPGPGSRCARFEDASIAGDQNAILRGPVRGRERWAAEPRHPQHALRAFADVRGNGSDWPPRQLCHPEGIWPVVDERECLAIRCQCRTTHDPHLAVGDAGEGESIVVAIELGAILDELTRPRNLLQLQCGL